MDDAVDSPAPYDLHLHTYWSYDATAHLENYFRRARETGVRCIAITEHHVLDSLDEVLEVSRRYPDVRAIPAAELTVTTPFGSHDLLCYGFPDSLPDDLEDVMDGYRLWQQAAGEAISRGMQDLGYEFDDAERLELLRSYRPPEAIDTQGNTHVKGGVLRAHFIERGFIDREEDYVDLLGVVQKKGRYPAYPHVSDVVPAVKRAGALVAIAHPFAYFGGYDLARMDAIREECQLDGIECAHASVPPEYTARYRDYCLQHGLF